MAIRLSDYAELPEVLKAQMLEAIDRQDAMSLDYFGLDCRAIQAEAAELSRATLIDYDAAFKHVALDHVERMVKPNEQLN